MSQLNPLNDLSRIYLDKVALMNRQEEQNDVERWQGALDDQMEKSSKKLATLGAPTMEKPGFEADDIIGTLALKGSKAGYRVVIVSGDKDMMQLVSPKVEMLDTMKNKRFGIKEVEEKFGVPPEKVIEVMGLMCDSSDHIPGVKGVGPKTATELIQKYGSIEGLYESIDEIELIRELNP